MPRKSSQEDLLAALESELRSRLLRELALVAEGKNTLFFTTSEFNPHHLPDHMLPTGTAELADLAARALKVSADLGDPQGAPVAALFRRYLARANDLSDHHRLGPVRLARELLDELVTIEVGEVGADVPTGPMT